MAGQQFDFTYDNIGNRSTQSEGGDANGLNLRQTSYTPNALNQYTTVNPPNAVDIIGIATATASVTVNGTTAYRKGEYYCQPLSVTNSSAPVTLPVTVTTTQGSSITQTGIVVVAKSTTTPTYDYDGNLTADGLWDYTWDAENRLIQVESVSSIGEAAKRKLVFTYDYAGRRATKKVYLWSGGSWSGTPSTDLKLVHDGRRLLAELNPTGNAPLRSYVWGQDVSGTFEGAGGIGGLVLQTHHGGSATNFFPAYDGNGNVTALVNAADQSIAARYEYSAFGETLRATEPLAKVNPIRFSTKCTDDETGLVCFGARYYHPDFGRWAARDPAAMVDGPNAYAFLGNGPLGKIDAWGLDGVQIDIKMVTKDEIYNNGSELLPGFADPRDLFFALGNTWINFETFRVPNVTHDWNPQTKRCAVKFLSRLNVDIISRSLSADLYGFPQALWINPRTPTGTTTLIYRGHVLSGMAAAEIFNHELKHARDLEEYYNSTWVKLEEEYDDFRHTSAGRLRYPTEMACAATVNKWVTDAFSRFLERERRAWRKLNAATAQLDNVVLLFQDIGAGFMEYFGERPRRPNDPLFFYDPVTGDFNARAIRPPAPPSRPTPVP